MHVYSAGASGGDKKKIQTRTLIALGPASTSVTCVTFVTFIAFISLISLQALSLIHISEPTRRA